MKKIIRVLSVVIAAAIAFSVLAVSGAAVEYYDIYSGTECTYKIADNSKLRLLYESDRSGELTVKLSYTSAYIVGVMTWGDENENVEYLKPSSITSAKGTAALLDVNDIPGFMASDDDEGKGCEFTLKYNVKKGFNLLTLSNESETDARSRKGGKLTVTVSFGKKQASIDMLTVTLNKGDTLRLGALLTDGTTGTAKWSSSKKSVATVNSSGKVTAKAKGTAVITAKYGSGTIKIQIKVTA